MDKKKVRVMISMFGRKRLWSWIYSDYEALKGYPAKHDYSVVDCILQLVVIDLLSCAFST